jgi:hypothetical protein
MDSSSNININHLLGKSHREARSSISLSSNLSPINLIIPSNNTRILPSSNIIPVRQLSTSLTNHTTLVSMM